MVDDKINTIQQLSSDRMVMRQAGFLEIFVNNEAQTPVYFDNLRVAQTSGVVSEVNAYYPFGMLIGALSFQAAGDEYNAYKYSAKELQTEMNLNWGDHGARMADYTIGRWWVPDPLSEKYFHISPYAYVANNPINAIDPDGKLVIFINGMHNGSQGGKSDYWNGFDLKVMEHLSDHRAIYKDGAIGGLGNLANNSSARTRRWHGTLQGRWDAESIVKMISDENGNLKETIKIISHSMGAAYAKGYVQSLLEYLKENNISTDFIEFEADFAPYQPAQQKAVDGVITYQFSHKRDIVAGNKEMEDSKEMDTKFDKKQGHGISAFVNQIMNLPEGKYRIENGQIVPY